MENILFRYSILPGDEKKVGEIVESTGFFYEAEVRLAVELAEEKIIEGANSSYTFIFAERAGQTIAYTCFGLIPGTESSFDLYWIATRADERGKGTGRILLEETERQIRKLGGRRVIAETSCRELYEPTRQFYLRMGYSQAGIIPDFYKDGDGKVTFVKGL